MTAKFRICCWIVLALCCGACAPVSQAEYWQNYLTDVRAEGLMRVDRAPSDIPLSPALLQDSFSRLAFQFENDPFHDGSDHGGAQMIRKWRTPVAYAVASNARDRLKIEAPVRDFVERLRTVTGHDFIETRLDDDETETTNLIVLFLRDSDFKSLVSYQSLLDAGYIRRTEDSDWYAFLNRAVEPWYDAPSPCAGHVLTTDGSDGSVPGEVIFAVVMIRAELPGALIESCIEEEMAQTLGLFNDDPKVRPTIFNDDEEFGLLTEHDRLLLSILYDQRLKPGMSRETAMPLVRQISSELLPEG